MSSIGKAMGGVLRSLGRLVDSAGCALQGRLAYRERCALCLMFFVFIYLIMLQWVAVAVDECVCCQTESTEKTSITS